jgi:hypothetical protein
MVRARDWQQAAAHVRTLAEIERRRIRLDGPCDHRLDPADPTTRCDVRGSHPHDQAGQPVHSHEWAPGRVLAWT